MLENDLLVAFTFQVKELCGLSQLAESDFHIALSGGLDSVVLLHLFSRLWQHEKKITICAHHINHGLSNNAVFWADFCSKLCTDLAIDFKYSAVHLIKKSRTSLEALAREKRYHCLTQALSDNSYLVTAHHQDDQLETVLLALKRGSGNTGLQGIHSKQKLVKGRLIRPLLNFSRAQLEAYAQSYNLKWIEDESNSDQLFDRNYIRHSISPLLKARWPSFPKTVARSASICQEQQQLLDEIAQLDFSTCVFSLLNQQVVKIESLKALSKARRNNVLRYWFKENNLNYPSAKQLLSVWTDIVLAGNNATPKIQFKGGSLRRYRENLYLVDDQEMNGFQKSIIWQGESQIKLFDGRRILNFKRSDKKNGGLIVQPNSRVEICLRSHLCSKLTCTPVGRTGSRSIKKLLHEYNVPPWLRSTVVFILIDGELQEALGLWQCQALPTECPSNYLTVSFS